MSETNSKPKTLPFFKNKKDYVFYSGDTTTHSDPTMITPMSHVYVEYDLRNPPPHPGNEWTRFVCISDTHSRIDFDIPDGDVLVHAGDMSSWGHFPQLLKTTKWLRSLPHPIKIVIAGNHDLCLDEEWVEGGDICQAVGNGIPKKEFDSAVDHMKHDADNLTAGIRYLCYESTKITPQNGRTWEVFGSPATPRFLMGSFQYVPGPAGRGEEIQARIPKTTEILITHTPPYGSCDLSKNGKHVGCPELQERLSGDDLSSCKLHVFGHIHEANGALIEPSGRVSVNAAMFGNHAIIVDLKN